MAKQIIPGQIESQFSWNFAFFMENDDLENMLLAKTHVQANPYSQSCSAC